MKNIEWGGIFKALEKWRLSWLAENSGGEDPAVSAIAEYYQEDPWAVLASTILSLRTKDDTTLAASKRLLGKYPAAKSLIGLPPAEIAELIYPVGFYRTKADNLVKIAGILESRHGGKVPADMEELLALPGVGRKTANLVLSEAYKIDAICVDVHVHRISNRAGWLGEQGTGTPEETETALRRILPRKYWQRINKLLVLYGQQLCRPTSPWCSRCVITPWCDRRSVGRSR